MRGKLESKIKRVVQASNLALVISDWSFSGTGPDGNPVNLTQQLQMSYVNSLMVRGVLS
jgi:hypothetical protein